MQRPQRDFIQPAVLRFKIRICDFLIIGTRNGIDRDPVYQQGIIAGSRQNFQFDITERISALKLIYRGQHIDMDPFFLDPAFGYPSVILFGILIEFLADLGKAQLEIQRRIRMMVD